MAGDNKKLQPIIIKRVKKGGHGHHGGAWKIAYADFVTAMMAFFLLMWLMGSVTEGDRKGIADYFNAPLKVMVMGQTGNSTGDAQSIIKGGGQDLTRSAGQVKKSDPDPAEAVRQLKAEQARQERRRLEALRAKVLSKLGENPRLAQMSSQIKVEMVRDGLRIQIVDERNRPMFATGSAVVQPYMRELLREIGQTLADISNRLTLEGHTDAQLYSGGERGYSNWELSSDRANASRRELIGAGLPEDRVLRVQGLASSVLFDPKDPLNPQNRRISILVMNREAEERFFRNASDLAEALDSAPEPASPGTVAPATPVPPNIRPRITP
ncbi:flagellar motor protein MotB [Azohydromonas lata]|uniref:Flagellar motor protein MotB n=1 Tax=Azohydromonas lata TaxID=45677 RepID=A0ABU5IH35_9BURK|nr:flagellar motor protein MotB [Azohydromonas lata]MDZ5457248.1 flagellar motor protein MotB [Azohydromonas lata]